MFKQTSIRQISGLMTYVEASYEELVALFGEPNGLGDLYKVSTQWVLIDEEKNVLTLYDYKQTDLYNRTLQSTPEFRAMKSYDWHIGGTNRFAAFRLKGYIEGKLSKKTELLISGEENV